MKTRVLADRFELQQQAAAGGMGSVWRARDLVNGITVAVKILALDRPFDRVRFERESQLLATLNHPNVVRYVAHGVTTDGVHYLVQEWVDGITLSTQSQTIGITASEAVTLAIGIAEALGAAHALGIIHRDVKPANIILDGGDVRAIKLVDFGIARLASDAGLLTRTGVLIGTPSYMAPEQARGSVIINAGADVWALGCVLYEMLCGRKAFGGKTPEAVRAQVLLAHHATLACPEAPPELFDLVDSMLAKDLNRRPRDGNEAADRLRALPPIPAGPRRRVGLPEPPTAVMPVRPKQEPPPEQNCFVYFTAAPADESDSPPPAVAEVKRISDKYQLEMHELEDGGVILKSVEPGPAGALASARAAMELQASGAVNVFAQGSDETIADAIDRGADVHVQAAMENLFADAIDNDGRIRIDSVVADMIESEMPVESTDIGHVLPMRRSNAG